MIRDIYSNYKPTVIDNNLILAGSTIGEEVFSGAFDLSGGETTFLTYFVNSLVSQAKVQYSIQYSVDEAFTNPVDDPLDLGNDVYNDYGTIITAIDPPSDFSTSRVIYVNIVNPPSEIGEASTAYRYARLKLTDYADNTGDSTVLTSVQKTGPQRFVAPKSDT